MMKSLFRKSDFRRFFNIASNRIFCTVKKELDETEITSEIKKSDVKSLLDAAATFQNDPHPAGEDVWATSPYPKGAELRNQALHSLRPRINPEETSIILFPGQGTQYVGMANALVRFPSAKDLFEHASSILKFDLLKLCLEGPADKLNRTENAQLAILVCSLGALERLKEEKPSAVENCVATAGFSLGEFAALVLAGVFSFERAVRLVKIRAEAMQIASELMPGAMLTVLYGADSKLSEACKEGEEHAKKSGVKLPYCRTSNYISPGCKIIAGNETAIRFIEENRSKFNLKLVKRLPVSGAFHTPLMAPAVEVFTSALRKAKLSEPMIAVHSNIDGKYYRNAEDIRRRLPKQIVAPVKWEQLLHILYERPQDMSFPRTYECGPGSSLSTILKRVNGKAFQECYQIKT